MLKIHKTKIFYYICTDIPIFYLNLRFMKKNLYLLIGLLFMATTAFAQTFQISGTVSNENGQSLPGVSVLIKGTTRGTVTDNDGKYSLEVKKGDILRFSYIGFDTQEITVENQHVQNVVLKSGVSLNEVVVTGTRFGGRTALQTAVPVDVIDVKTIKTVTAQTDLNQLLNYSVPSFTSNTQTISDGTDEVDPASLRGLGPDQVLVLINGKRRHPSSLINVNGTFGRGNVGTDLNTIPASAISSIQVLRDGASAQYGSDAIAGVINIILKKNTDQLAVSATTGAYASKNSNALEGGIDGPTTDISANYGIGLGKKGGYLNFTGEFSYRDYYNRMGSYTGTIFDGYNAIEWQAYKDGADISRLTLDQIKHYSQLTSAFDQSLKNSINGASSLGDVRALLSDANGKPLDFTEAELAERGQTRHDYIMRVGQSALRGGKLFANLSIPIDKHGTEFYAFGGMSYRKGNAAGFYRLPNQNRTFTPIYINGFLPEILTDIKDKSLSFGIRGAIRDWKIDFSNTYGTNSMMYTVDNSLNASMQNASPTSFNSGGFSFTQNTVNLDITKRYSEIMAGLNMAFGAEYRLENYQIVAGEVASYATYDTLGQVITSPFQVAPVDFFGRSRPGGAQVFPGFRPSNELSKYRNSIAVYADVEANFTKSFMLDGAIRYENYSDFGSTFNGKLAGRIMVGKNLNLRASVSTGFRAPSLQQMYFNSTSTLFNDVGVPEEVGLFANDSKVAKLLGIPKLKQETSQSVSAGLTLKIPKAFLSITIDGYLIAIQNRIVLTGQFKPTTPDLVQLFRMAGATKAAFFSNAIDTRSQGLDIVIDNNLTFGNNVSLKNTLSATFSATKKVGSIHASPVLEASGQIDVYFDKRAEIFLEKAVPHTKFNLSNLLTVKNWHFFLRNVYFGKVTEANNIPALQQVFRGKVITDISVGYNVSRGFNVTLGANNVFDIYPDKNIPENRSSGRFIWSRRSQQFGFGGRFIFARLRFDL
jgi:iron complex outermembrane receptor protein